jgi:hypothetical protein
VIREQGDTLHLLSAVSPDWAGVGKTIQVTHAPSYFGSTNMTLTNRSGNTATLTLADTWTHSPHARVVHVPWFVQGVQAKADGRSVPVANGAVSIPVAIRTVTLTWKNRLPVNMSFARAVASYEAEYRRRYALLLKIGTTAIGPQWQVPG